MTQHLISTGDVHLVRYPFVRTTFESIGEDGYETVASWQPGTIAESGYDDVSYGADGEGWQEITVVDVFQPGSFPTRVFYTRRWIDPTGRAFGKRRLLICTREKFRRLIAGYRFHYDLNRADDPVAPLPTPPAGEQA
ncbi:hypothetical protein [Sphingomonas sp. 1P08PE]|uniref:hypothetical protein n=1 Tax=Sphingomonas sp. 1P08PE TaxID=554122 RepID=UPI00399FEEBF